MKQLPSALKKQRSREVTAAVEGWGAGVYQHLVGAVQRCCVVDRAADGRHLVAHNKSYAQVCGPGRSRPARARGPAARRNQHLPASCSCPADCRHPA